MIIRHHKYFALKVEKKDTEGQPLVAEARYEITTDGKYRRLTVAEDAWCDAKYRDGCTEVLGSWWDTNAVIEWDFTDAESEWNVRVY